MPQPHKGPVTTLLEDCMELLNHRSFLQAYYKRFELIRADTAALKKKAFGLRFKVYCEEHGVEDPHEDGSYIERDLYDERSVHYILMHKFTRETVGTLRVVLPNDDSPAESFPAQQHCDHPLLKYDSRALSLCEISRFCTAPRFRKREADGPFLSAYHDQDVHGGFRMDGMTFVRRRIPYMQAALLQGAFEAAMEARILDCVWMVEPAHLESLRQIGFPYRVLGPKVKAHGGLQPVIFNIKQVLDTMRHRRPHCWDIVSDQGRLQRMADDLIRHDWEDRLMDETCREDIYSKLAAE